MPVRHPFIEGFVAYRIENNTSVNSALVNYFIDNSYRLDGESRAGIGFEVEVVEVARIQFRSGLMGWIGVAYNAGGGWASFILGLSRGNAPFGNARYTSSTISRTSQIYGALQSVRDSRCDDCGTMLTDHNAAESGSLCISCAEESSYRACSRCDRRESYVGPRHTTMPNGELLCDECYVDSGWQRCDNCSSACHVNEMGAYNGGILCRSCLREFSRACDQCGAVGMRLERVRVQSYTYSYLCPMCRALQNPVLNYSFKPAWKKQGEGDLFFGVELEVEVDERDGYPIATEVQRDYSVGKELFFIKRDASVNGWELVTHPFSLQYHIESFNWAGLLRYLRSKECRSHSHGSRSSCGLHIHVSRGWLSIEGEIRLGYFVSTQKKNLEVLSRREETHFAAYKKKYLRAGESSIYDAHHYDAVNFQNDETIEIRTFKGTLNHNTLLATLELCDALVRFCEAIENDDIRDQEKGWAAFLGWVRAQGYQKLEKYMKNRGVI